MVMKMKDELLITDMIKNLDELILKYDVYCTLNNLKKENKL